MTEPAPACDAHRALVDAALGPHPPDDVLERFAREASECPACRRAVSARLGVHPVVLERAARGPGPADPAGMRELRAALQSRTWRRPVLVAVAAAAAVALAATAWTWGSAPAARVEGPPPVAEAPPGPTVVPVLPRDADPRPVPTPIVRRVERLPLPLRTTPPEGGLPRPLPDPVDDAVALAPDDDWPAPAFEELRGGRPKSTDAPIRAVQLVLSGDHRVGGRVELTVVASADTELAVCVTGPERGVVWRGGVPAGRTELTRGDRQQAFAFAAPGTYRFAVSTSEVDRCAEPVHIVEVEVGG